MLTTDTPEASHEEELPETTPPATPPPSDERSMAAKFLDKLKSKDNVAAENATLKSRVSSLEASLATSLAETETLAGAAEALTAQQSTLRMVESALGLTPNALDTAQAADISAAISRQVSARLIDTAALAGVDVSKLPAAASADVDPEDAKTNALTGMDRVQAAMAKRFQKFN